ncbi:MAG: NAD-dependent epimerase/dehydratase family protein [Bacteroidota bacterium]
MHVYLTGATGFVGSYVLKRLLADGHTVRCLVRNPSTARLPDGVEVVKGDITVPKSVLGTMRGCDAVIHLVGIIEEQPSKGVTFEAIHYQGTVHVVDAAKDAEIERFVHMSANGARPNGVSAYQTSKWKAEEYVRDAAFTHTTVFAPSVLFGDPGPDNPEFASQLADTLIKPFPVLPIFGDGQYLMQPISVEEVADAFVQALTTPEASGQRFCVAGQEQIPYVVVLDIITKALGLAAKPKIPSPIWLVRPAVQAAGKFGLLPISPDQFEMLVEGNTCDNASLYATFALTPRAFTPDALAYLRD